MRLIRPSLLAALALFPLGLVACANNARPDYGVPVTVGELTTTHVLNTNTFPVTIYLVQSGMKRRLGSVESMSAGLFQIPPQLLEVRRDFRLIATPLGPHPTYVSETFMIQPGQQANWRVQELTARETAVVSLVSVH